jgi:AcrR family transcriptional regulator
MMPPKKKFELAQIVDAAFKIVRREGFSAVSARSIAAELGSSTTPIYWALESMDKVEDALRVKTLELMAEFQAKKFTDNVFINLAVGYVEFARCEPNLFRFLAIERQKPLNIKEEGVFEEALTNQLGFKPPVKSAIGEIDQKSMDNLTLMSLIFNYGLAVAVSSNMLKFDSEEEIRDLVTRAGGAFYMQQQSSLKK